MTPRYSVDNASIVESFSRRIAVAHRGADIQIGTGNTNGEVIVIQSTAKMPERDAITGALKKFSMLHGTYRATSLIVDYPNTCNILPTTQIEINRYYLKELIEMIRPTLVIMCGPDVLSMIRKRKVRMFDTHIGKRIRIPDMPTITFLAVTNPADYGYARAPQDLKTRGLKEWQVVSKIYQHLKEKLEKERWDY